MKNILKCGALVEFIIWLIYTFIFFLNGRTDISIWFSIISIFNLILVVEFLGAMVFDE